MSDTSGNGAPKWKQLCNAALAELDPAKLPERIAEARRAVLDRIEDNFSGSANDDHQALRNALEALTALQAVVKRDTIQREIEEQCKTGS